MTPLTQITDEQFTELYQNGFIKISGLFTEQQLKNLKEARDHCFEEFPYGQDNECNRRTDANPLKSGYFPYHNCFTIDHRFCEMLTHPLILNTAKKILGPGFCITSNVMRKVPPDVPVMPVHRDMCGSMNVSILLDEIGENEGATCVYPGTHFNYPPPEYGIDPTKINGGSVQTTGSFGDVYIWFPELWHGRVLNTGTRGTTLMMTDYENHAQRNGTMIPFHKATYSEDLPENFKKLISGESTEKPYEGLDSTLNNLFQKTGNSTGSLLRRYLYIFLAYRLKKTRGLATHKNFVYTRKFSDEILANTNFSLFNYLSKIQPKRFAKMSVARTLNAIPGGKKLKTKLKSLKK